MDRRELLVDGVIHEAALDLGLKVGRDSCEVRGVWFGKERQNCFQTQKTS